MKTAAAVFFIRKTCRMNVISANNFFIPLKYFFAFFLRARRYTAHAGQASAQKKQESE
jgi:hypothetical protein